jgi:hypothetical protein
MTKALIAITALMLIGGGSVVAAIKPVPLRPHTMALVRDGKAVPLRLLDGKPGQNVCWYGTPEGDTLFGACPTTNFPVEPRDPLPLNRFPVVFL